MIDHDVLFFFAFVSFLPVRKAKERPKVYIVVSFGLNFSSAEEIDDELMGWIREAGVFSAGKREKSAPKGKKKEDTGEGRGYVL